MRATRCCVGGGGLRVIDRVVRRRFDQRRLVRALVLEHAYRVERARCTLRFSREVGCDVGEGRHSDRHAVSGRAWQRRRTGGRLGFEAVRAMPVGSRLPDIELVTVSAAAHPVGSPDLAVVALRELVDSGVIAVIGPCGADNALACLPVADELQVPCINWSGSERTRSEWMFHYQVGSHEDEPYVIAEYMARRGWRRVALVRENSTIGRDHGSFFVDAAVVHGLEIVTTIDLDVQGSNGSAAAAAVDRVAPDAVVFLGFPSVGGFASCDAGTITAGDRELGSDRRTFRLGPGGRVGRLELHRRLRRREPRVPTSPGPVAGCTRPPAIAPLRHGRLVAFGLIHAPTPTPRACRSASNV